MADITRMTRGMLIIGVDVGGTNTDSALLDISKPGTQAVRASHKASTTSNVTLSVQATLTALLEKSTVKRTEVGALAIGTTHFLNAIIERDCSRVEKVAVLRLASHDFSAGTPPFVDWPSALKRIVHGHSAIIPGGCNIGGALIANIDEEAVLKEVEIIRSKGIRNVVIVGIGSPTDSKYHQEDKVRDIIAAKLGKDVNIVCSHNVAGPGLLARENASILNASILNFARRTIRSFMGAMQKIGLQCPLYLTSNAGHLLPFSEAMQFPIRIFSSGATNSIRGAAFLASSDMGQNGCIVIDIGGTTTDVGYLLKNGYPRLAKSYTDLAGVKINLEMPSVESIGLGGGSILHINPNGQVLVGPESVGHDLLTRALCFGGDTGTATDIASATGTAIGNGDLVILTPSAIENGKARIKKMLEVIIDRTKLSPEPCTVILIGGGSILCPTELAGVDRIIVPEHASVANAIGAAYAKIAASAELIVESSGIKAGITNVMNQAIQKVIAKGGDSTSITILNQEVIGVPYTEGWTKIRVEVACPADHGKVYEEFIRAGNVEGVVNDVFEETTKRTLNGEETIVDEQPNLQTYKPLIDADGTWILSETDLRFLAIGTYMLGCGGGGSTYASYLQLRQLLQDGETIKISSFEDLKDDDVLPAIAAVGTPEVSIERPGGNSVLHALQAMSLEQNAQYTKLLTTEIGGANGIEALIWGSSKHYGMAMVDGDLMGRAYPSFEMISVYITASSINELLPVTLCSGTGETIVIPATQTDEVSAGMEIRLACVDMGSAVGAVMRPMSGKEMRNVGIPNTHSLAWRLGRVVALAQQQASLATVAEGIIAECGGDKSARRIFQGKIRSVESSLTKTAHSIGKVTIERLSDSEMENESDRVDGPNEVVIPFMNENLAVLEVDSEGRESVLATVPDLIFLLDTSTGENVGVQEYRYGLKVTVMAMAPHPMWTSKRGLEIGGPRAFQLLYEYSSTLVYTKPRGVIEEFRVAS